MHLFKYGTAERIDILTNHEIRFTQVSDFNDPFEVHPHIGSVLPPGQEDTVLAQFEPEMPKLYEAALQEALAERGLTLDRLDEMAVEFGLPGKARDYLMPKNIGAEATRLTKAFIPVLLEQMRAQSFGASLHERFSEKFGVLSLSELPTSLLMWAHYGNSHRGLTIGFDSSHRFFNQPHGFGVGRLLKVAYAEERPAITMYDPNASGEEYANRLIRDVLLTKSVEWQYEREMRMVLPLDDVAQFPHRVVGGRYHLFPIPPEALRCVVIGARAGESVAVAVAAAIQSDSRLQHVTVHQARISSTRFEVVIEPPVTAA